MPVVVPAISLPLLAADAPPVDVKFEVGPWNQLPATDLPDLTSRSITWRVTGQHEASFTIDGNQPQAAQVNEVDSDLWVSLNSRVFYRGPVGGSSDTIDADTESAQFSSADYRTLLDRRFLIEGDSLVYASEDQAQICWDLIAQNQAKPGRNLNLHQGSGYTTGIVPPTTTYAVGTSVLAAINQLAQGSQGFDWDITPLTGSTRMNFDVWYPQRGTNRGEVIDFPGRIQTLGATFDPTTYAKVIRGSAADSVPAYTATASDVATSGDRVLEQLFSDTDIQTLSGLQSRTDAELVKAQTVTRSWTATLAADGWQGPDQIWLGDPVTLVITTGRHAGLVESLRVQEITLAIDDDTSAATATFTLGQPKPDKRWNLRTFDKRIAQLAKR